MASLAWAVSGHLDFLHGSWVPPEPVPLECLRSHTASLSPLLCWSKEASAHPDSRGEHRLHSLEVLKNLGPFFLNHHISVVCRILHPCPKPLWLELVESYVAGCGCLLEGAGRRAGSVRPPHSDTPFPGNGVFSHPLPWLHRVLD